MSTSKRTSSASVARHFFHELPKHVKPLVFYDSLRRVTPARAKEIISTRGARTLTRCARPGDSHSYIYIVACIRRPCGKRSA
jgi:hypothetical protein